jgi:uncharacterized protein YukE
MTTPAGLVKVQVAAMETFSGQAKTVITRVTDELKRMETEARRLLAGSWADGGSARFEMVHAMVDQVGAEGVELMTKIDQAVLTTSANAQATEQRSMRRMDGIQI